MKKFIDFNGKPIYFVLVDATWWVAVKPICDALSVNYDRQFKNLKANNFLNQLYAVQHIVAADGKIRKMVCLPEFYVYGWLFKINSNSPKLEEYQWKCYEILYNNFHGLITGRENLLHNKHQKITVLGQLREKLAGNEDYIQMVDIEKDLKKINVALQENDKTILSGQGILFE